MVSVVTTKTTSMSLGWLKSRAYWQYLLLLALCVTAWGVLSPNQFMNFWLTKDQQGYVHFKQGDYAQAQASFESPAWKAHSAYLAGDFQSVLTLLQETNDDRARYLMANALAYSNQFEQAKALYTALYMAKSTEPSLQAEMKQNIEIINAAIDKQKNAPLEKQEGDKKIDDRSIATSDEEATLGKPTELSNQVWLKQVRQDPSKFLRQKFQQEFANENE
ncbi:hypothetical protein VINE108521_08645 [Vibrio neonatus]